MADKYIFPNELKPEDVKSVRKMLKLTQTEFAEFVCVSKQTVVRWETGTTKVAGSIVFVIETLRRQPEIMEYFKVPEKEYPLRLMYYYKSMLCTIIDVSIVTQRVKIKNYTDNLLFRAFGINEHPTYIDYEDFLESRCFPRTRDKMKLVLEDLDIPFYDPMMIIEKTEGRMAEDDFWIKIER